MGNIDGLNNPRHITLSETNNWVFVTSADDNSVLVLKFNDTLTPHQLFKNKENAAYRLEGANQVRSFNHDRRFAVASFYDSALTFFDQHEDQTFSFTKAYSDEIDYERVFKNNEPLNSEDRLGLSGAWDFVVSEDKSVIYVSSYKSNAIATLKINDKNCLVNTNVFSPSTPDDLGSPANLVLAKSRQHLIVSGFDGNQLTVIEVGQDGHLSVKQTLQNNTFGIANLVAPQQLVLSSDERYLYVASSGGNAIIVFEFTNGKYVYLQSITQKDTSGHGLKGVASLALSKHDNFLYAAGEFDTGLLVFDVMQNGKLTPRKHIQFNNHKIEGVSSIALSNDDKHVLLTLGQKDALYLLSALEP